MECYLGPRRRRYAKPFVAPAAETAGGKSSFRDWIGKREEKERTSMNLDWDGMEKR